MQFRPGEPYRGRIITRGDVLFLPGGFPETGDARFLHRVSAAPTIRARKDGKRKKNTRRIALRARSHVSNHVGQCSSVPILGFFSFFFSLARSIAYRLALLFCLPSRRIRASQFIELFNTKTGRREIRAALKLMDSCKDAHNGPNESEFKDPHLRQIDRFPAIFAPTVAKGCDYDREIGSARFSLDLELTASLTLYVQVYRSRLF